MTPGQRSAYAKLPRVGRVRKVRPAGALRVNANDYAATFEAAGGTFEQYMAGVTLDELGERSVAPLAPRMPFLAYVPVPWSAFDSADRYAVPS